MKILLAALLLVFGLMQYKLWLGDGGYAGVHRLEQRVAEQAEENARLALRNRELEAEVADLRQGIDAVEERARSELGMIKQEEEFYQVVAGEPAEPADRVPQE